ncbi:MAG: glutathione S-transferase family protein [Marinomonas sp.]
MSKPAPILYFAPSTCARVTLTALEEIGQPFETRLIAFMAGEHRKPEYLAINPSGKVPALDTREGIITQNGSILLYLAREYPEAGLLPLAGDPLIDAESTTMLFRLSADLHPLVTRFVLPQMLVAEAEAAPHLRAKTRDFLNQQLAPFEQLLTKKEWVLGDQWSILDAYLAWVWFRITGAGFDTGAYPAISAHSQLSNARPSAQAALAREAQAQEELTARGLAFTPPPAD